MRPKNRKIKLGILGCGAIGSGVANRVAKDLKNTCIISSLYDINTERTKKLVKQIHLNSTIATTPFDSFLRSCDLVLEAIDSPKTSLLVKDILNAKKDIVVMSVGAVLNANNLFALAKKNQCNIMVPSGAIAGIDAIKTATQVPYTKITLTTKKPVKGLLGNPHLKKRQIDLAKIKEDTTIFSGKVDQAIKIFPQNINVAATLALACGSKKKLHVRIIASPKAKTNRHEITLEGASGKITTISENIPCPDNPKTSYLAVLSGVQVIKDYCNQF